MHEAYLRILDNLYDFLCYQNNTTWGVCGRRDWHLWLPVNQRHEIFQLVSLVFLAGAAASPQLVPSASDQSPLSFKLGEHISITSTMVFHLDLNAQRLVEMEGQEPVWMTGVREGTIINSFMLPIN